MPTRADLLSCKDPEDLKVIQSVIDRYLECDKWAVKALKDVAVLITSHPGNRPYLKACVETHKSLGLWIALAYDNYIDPDRESVDHNARMPAKDVLDNVDTIIMPHHQNWGGVLYPYFWLLKFGLNALSDFEYVYCVNGDFILEKPEGMLEIIQTARGYDFVSCGPVTHNTVNTAGFVIKTSVVKAIIKHFQDHFIPLDNYEKYTLQVGNAEGRFSAAIRDLGLKHLVVPGPEDEQIPYPGKGLWCEKAGFRHIHYEHGIAYRNRSIPPDVKYLDGRYMGSEYEIIKQYWETKDLKVLENWWPKG